MAALAKRRSVYLSSPCMKMTGVKPAVQKFTSEDRFIIIFGGGGTVGGYTFGCFDFYE